MRILPYINYFFYVASRWDLQTAWHILSKEIYGEKKYSLNTTGADDLQKLEEKGIDISHAASYMPASYDILEVAFEEIKQYHLSNFLDVGCGKGRAMCVAAHHGFKQVSGIDFSKELCRDAIKNLIITKTAFPTLSYKVIHNDAFYYEIPAHIDCIFFFNPFDELIMSGVIKNIDDSLEEFPRDLFIIYVNPVDKKQFIKTGYKIIFSKKFKYMELYILKKEMAPI